MAQASSEDSSIYSLIEHFTLDAVREFVLARDEVRRMGQAETAVPSSDSDAVTARPAKQSPTLRSPMREVAS